MSSIFSSCLRPPPMSAFVRVRKHVHIRSIYILSSHKHRVEQCFQRVKKHAHPPAWLSRTRKRTGIASPATVFHRARPRWRIAMNPTSTPNVTAPARAICTDETLFFRGRERATEEPELTCRHHDEYCTHACTSVESGGGFIRSGSCRSPTPTPPLMCWARVEHHERQACVSQATCFGSAYRSKERRSSFNYDVFRQQGLSK